MKETPNTIKAKEILENKSGFPVIIKTLDELSIEYNLPNIKEYFGVHNFNGKEHIIGVNSNKPETNETTFVHECIHGIMVAEGFPRVEYLYLTGNPQEEKILKILTSYFSSSIQHPEIYRRMNDDFELNMSKYFQGLIIQKKNRLQKKPDNFNNDIEKVFSIQQDIIDGHEYFFYEPKSKTEILNELQEKSNGAYNFLLGIQKAKFDFYTPNSNRESAKKFLKKIIKYGEKRIGSSLTKRFWSNLKIK